MSGFLDTLDSFTQLGQTDKYGNTGTANIPATEPSQGGGYVANPPGFPSAPSSTTGTATATGTSTTGGATTPFAQALGSLTSLGSSIKDTVSSSVPSTGGADAGSSSLQNLVFIGLGLLLIAAGVFSFRQTQTILQSGSKIAAKGAELIP